MDLQLTIQQVERLVELLEKNGEGWFDENIKKYLDYKAKCFHDEWKSESLDLDEIPF